MRSRFGSRDSPSARSNDVLGNHANTKVKEEEPRITLTLPAACDDEDAVQAVLTGFLLTVCSCGTIILSISKLWRCNKC